ncbi:MAG: hypothetical protein KFF68_09290, partial [Desulfosarcina sp.]|nr:hypothetical protein [Desulfosarcina sp.]
ILGALGTGRNGYPSAKAPSFKIQIESTAQFNENYVLATQNINSLFVIWCHWCGLGDPAKVRTWLEQLPNLHCDLGWLHQDQSAFPNRLVDDDGRFIPAWKELIEAYPDRFLAAINASDIEDFQKQYQTRVKKVRKALGDLQPTVARKVATENLHRLLGQ